MEKIILGGMDEFEVAESEYFGILHRSQFLLSESTVQKRSPPLGMRHRKTRFGKDGDADWGGVLIVLNSGRSQALRISGSQDLRLSGSQDLWSLESP